MINLTKEIIGNFESKLKGEFVLPSDPTYDEVRKIWNAMIERHPYPEGLNVPLVRTWRTHGTVPQEAQLMDSCVYLSLAG